MSLLILLDQIYVAPRPENNQPTMSNLTLEETDCCSEGRQFIKDSVRKDHYSITIMKETTITPLQIGRAHV